jgi:hypothetical protein
MMTPDNCLKNFLPSFSMSDNNNNQQKKPEERLIAADEDKKPHLENMANVQGSNKNRNDNADRNGK